MIQKQIGEKIRKKRIETGLSQEQLALLSGVTPTYLGQIERGERNPTVGLLEKLGESLDIDITYFFEDHYSTSIDRYTERILKCMQDLNDEQKSTVLQIIIMISKVLKENNN